MGPEKVGMGVENSGEKSKRVMSIEVKHETEQHLAVKKLVKKTWY